MAACLIQRRIRRWLTKKRANLRNRHSFMINKKDPLQNLKLVEKGFMNLAGQYFNFSIYTDQMELTVKFTIREFKHKLTVVSLKEIRMHDFQEDAEVEDVVDYIKEQLKEEGEKAMLDERGNLKEDWPQCLYEFIEDNI